MVVPPMDKQKMIDHLFENAKFENVEKMVCINYYNRLIGNFVRFTKIKVLTVA